MSRAVSETKKGSQTVHAAGMSPSRENHRLRRLAGGRSCGFIEEVLAPSGAAGQTKFQGEASPELQPRGGEYCGSFAPTSR